MDRLEKLENISIKIIREAYSEFNNLCMLWSIGKDSTVMLYLVRKAFFGHVPFPLIHIDTHYKIPEMIEYRDKIAKEWKLEMIYGENTKAIREKRTFPDGNVNRTECCKLLKTEALDGVLSGKQCRYRLNHLTGKYEIDDDTTPFNGVLVGIRADEEGSRSKERYFSTRDNNNNWDIENQPAEFWSQYKTEFKAGTHVRVHPLLDWTELDIWKFIQKYNIPTVSLYYNQGNGKRYRSLGCYPCTFPIDSEAKNVEEIIEELETGKLAGIAERAGRGQDKEERRIRNTKKRRIYVGKEGKR